MSRDDWEEGDECCFDLHFGGWFECREVMMGFVEEGWMMKLKCEETTRALRETDRRISSSFYSQPAQAVLGKHNSGVFASIEKKVVKASPVRF